MRKTFKKNLLKSSRRLRANYSLCTNLRFMAKDFSPAGGTADALGSGGRRYSFIRMSKLTNVRGHRLYYQPKASGTHLCHLFDGGAGVLGIPRRASSIRLLEIESEGE